MAALRERLGFAPGDFVVGSFGLLTREKQIETLARAVARAAVHLPNCVCCSRARPGCAGPRRTCSSAWACAAARS